MTMWLDEQFDAFVPPDTENDSKVLYPSMVTH